MSHTSNRIYRDTQNNQGVCIADIQVVLGSPRNDIGGLITYGDINKWAKYKPVRSNKLGILTDSDRQQVMWGLSIAARTELGVYTTQGSFLYDLTHGLLAWDYLRPRGQSQSPKEWFRFLDFDGYNSECICPIGDLEQDVPIDTYGTATLTWDDIDIAQIPGNLALTDISVNSTGIANYYLGLFLVKGSTTNILTSTSPIGSSGGISIEITNATSLKGTWRAYPFFSSVQIPFGSPSSLTTGVFFSAGWDVPYKDISFRLTSESLSIYVYGTWNSSHTAFSYYIEAYNEDSASKTVNPTIELKKNQDASTEPTSAGAIDTWSFGSITVPGNDSYSTIENPSTRSLVEAYDDDYIYWLGGAVQNYSTNYVQIEDNNDFDPTI